MYNRESIGVQVESQECAEGGHLGGVRGGECRLEHGEWQHGKGVRKEPAKKGHQAKKKPLESGKRATGKGSCSLGLATCDLGKDSWPGKLNRGGSGVGVVRRQGQQAWAALSWLGLRRKKREQ